MITFLLYIRFKSLHTISFISAEDYSPTTDQAGALLGFATSTTPACFTFLAVDDSLPDGGEMFSVLLTSTDGFPAGPGGLQLERDSVTITIVEPTTPPPPDTDVEGMYTD